MGVDYIPEADAAALTWMRAFAANVSEQPFSYGLALPDVTAVNQVVTAFAEAFAVVRIPGTRTAVTTSAKDQARCTAESVIRRYAGLIKADGGVCDELRIAAGLPLPKTSRRSVLSVPGSSPILAVLSATNRIHNLCFHDSLAPTRRAKPYGAVGLQLFVHIADEQVQHPTDAKFCGTVTKSRFSVTQETEDSGKYATYFGRWASRRGEVGPFSLGAGMRIVA